MNDLPPPGQAPRRPPLTALRIVFVVVGIVAMVFSGGCSLLVLSDAWQVWPLALFFGGIPFVLGLLTTWMALRLGRHPVP